MEDADKNIYLDFGSYHSIANIGYQHPKLIKAIKKSLDDPLIGFFNTTGKSVMLHKKLGEITPGKFDKRVFLSLSGGGANDISMRLARWSKQRHYIIGFTGAYHGQTYGAFTLTTMGRQSGFYPLVSGVRIMPYPYCYRCSFKLEYPDCDLQCLRYIEETAFKTYMPAEDVAAVTIEPIQGDAGWIVPPNRYLPELKKLCEENGIIFIAEEVQSGMGRTGKWFAVEHWSIDPDIILLGKALAGGLPLSAVIAKAEIAEPSGRKGQMGAVFSTGMNPICCTAALSTIEIISKERLVENASRVGEHMIKRLRDMEKEHRIIGDVRGKGLMIGVEIVKDKKTKEPGIDEVSLVCRKAFEKGLAIIHMGLYRTTLRVHPPLVITEEQADMGLDILEESISESEREI
jgi:4-aminobutyrate aminotransferase